tara:strand:+ start:5946 stop:6386 length:441 start_codon:yes stop_codon:yes gene_type:complete
MVNENEMLPPENAGLNIMNGFALDEQNQQGFFKTTRIYLEPGKSKEQLQGTTNLTAEQAMDASTILAKNINTRNRISRAERKKSNSNKDEIDYSEMTYAETQLYTYFELAKSINGKARREGQGILTGNLEPEVQRQSSWLPKRRKS